MKSFIFVVLGTFILALSTALFLVPFELVAGGISGIAIIVAEMSGASFLSVEVIITALSWSAFLIGLLVLGKSFALKTLISTALYPLFVTIFIESGFSDFLAQLMPNTVGVIFASLLGGALVGLGLGLSFYGGGSTGGVDILAIAVCKKFTKFKTPRVILAIDSAIIILGAFVIKDVKTSLLGIVSAVVAASVIECVFGNFKKS